METATRWQPGAVKFVRSLRDPVNILIGAYAACLLQTFGQMPLSLGFVFYLRQPTHGAA
jgi:hypothetical protein